MLRWISTLAAVAALIILLSTCAPQATNSQSTAPSTELSTGQEAGLGTPIVIPRGQYDEIIGVKTVSFMAHDLESGAYYVLGGSDVYARHTPWSTFKIPNLIIALETGAAQDLGHAIEWDSARRPAQDFWPKSWKQDLTLGEAFKVSAAWFFRDIALQIPNEVYRETLARWGYGNAMAADGNDAFWLDRTLKISTAEQVAFLDALTSGDLGVSAASLKALNTASRSGEISGLIMHGKTGSGPVNVNDFDGEFEGWYVGFLMKDDAPWMTFALHARADRYADIRSFRRDFAITLTKEVLRLQATQR